MEYRRPSILAFYIYDEISAYFNTACGAAAEAVLDPEISSRMLISTIGAGERPMGKGTIVGP